VIKKFIKRCLGSLEKATSDKSDKPLRYPPIFIIGPPRSGSTLLSQVLIEQFQLGYFSNLHDKFATNPALVERLLHVSRWPRKPIYESTHGKTTGWTGPNESWDYWYRFFSRYPQYVAENDADPQKLAELRGSMRALGNAFKRPILIKNLPCALRLGPLHRALPEALYLVIHRDWVEMGRSILLARKRLHGAYCKWVSLEPPGFEALQRRPAHEQVIEQIRSTYAVIDEARARYDADRFLDVGYEQFCDNVPTTLQSIADFIASHGVRLGERRAVPKKFPLSPGSPIESELLAQLQDYASASKPSLYGRG
jgi:hypothetical protein